MGKVCQNNLCLNVSGQCFSNTNCAGTNPYCDLNYDACAQCVGSLGCPAGTPCIDDTCGCLTDSDCATLSPATTCLPATGACVE
jgi:hypothetical protein